MDKGGGFPRPAPVRIPLMRNRKSPKASAFGDFTRPVQISKKAIAAELRNVAGKKNRGGFVGAKSNQVIPGSDPTVYSNNAASIPDVKKKPNGNLNRRIPFKVSMPSIKGR